VPCPQAEGVAPLVEGGPAAEDDGYISTQIAPATKTREAQVGQGRIASLIQSDRLHAVQVSQMARLIVHSTAGLQAFLVSAIDAQLLYAAPSHLVTTIRGHRQHRLARTGPQGEEGGGAGGVPRGADYGDLMEIRYTSRY
jgi:hypothetical protein